MSMRGLLAFLLVAVAVVGCEDRKKPTIADGLLIVEPGGLDFGTIAIFQEKSQNVRLVNSGRGRLVIHDAWMESEDGSYVSTFLHEGPHNLISGSSCELKVRFAPTKAGKKPAYLVIKTDGSLAPLMKVPVLGEAMDVALEVKEHKLEFGRIELEAEKMLTVAYRNPSLLPVEVKPEIIGSDADEFSTQSFVLQPGEERYAPVFFNPKRVGIKSASIAVAACTGCVASVIGLHAEGLEQAVIAVPPEVDLGQVPIDRDATGEAVVKNISTETRTLSSMTLTESTDPSFTLAPDNFPMTIAPGQEKKFRIRYSPGHMGAATGELKVSVDSKRHPTTDFSVKAWGGSPELCVSPNFYDFGEQPVGSLTSVTVTIRNCGSANGNKLRVEKIYITAASATGANSGEDQFRFTGITLPLELAANEERTFKVYFEPNRAGPATMTLHVESTGFSAQHLKFAYGGTARLYAPCNLIVSPLAVDFGTLPPAQGAVLGVKMTNAGTELCAVKNIHLSNDGGGVFFLPGGDIEGLTVLPGNAFSLMVAYRPKSNGQSVGMLDVSISNPMTPLVQIPLKANTEESCLVATPPYLDFGRSRPDCAPPPLVVRLENTCTTPVNVNDIFIGPGTTDGEFTITEKPATPATVQPGQSFRVEVTYAAQVSGMNLSPLFIGADDNAAPLMVTLLGESSLNGNQTDTFTQQDGSKVDVLFVVDNTASMIEEHPRLISAIPSFVNAALGRGVDMNVAVTTTGITAANSACPGGANGGEAGRLFPADGSFQRILESSTPNLSTALQRNVDVGQCAFVEQGFEAVRRALTAPLVNRADDPRTALPDDGNLGFLRTEAALAVVFVSDEDDHSPDDVDTYVQFLKTAKGMYQPQRVTAFAIAPTATGCSTAGGAGTRYAQLVQKTGGDVMSVCSGDYAPLLQQVATKAFSAQTRFPLSARPDAGTIKVIVNGTEQTSGWSYDSATNSVSFSPVPPAGARISITYKRSCQ